MVKKIACFFSGGYTEAAGYMQLFLNKITDKYEFSQYIPNSTRKRKGTPKNISDEYSGLTGDRLIDKVYTYLSKSYIKEMFRKGELSGVLIEDDLDGRFEQPGAGKIDDWENEIKHKIFSIVERKIPVFFIYAAPEVEGWFIADWSNGFEKFFIRVLDFSELDIRSKQKFCHDLKKKIDEDLLSNGNTKIEKYAFLNGQYRKLSSDLIDTIEMINKKTIESLIKRKEIPDNVKGFYYSKKSHGPLILRDLDPVKVKEKCDEYFKRSYLSLKNEDGVSKA